MPYSVAINSALCDSTAVIRTCANVTYCRTFEVELHFRGKLQFATVQRKLIARLCVIKDVVTVFRR